MSKNIYVMLVICFVVIASFIIIVYNTHMLMKDVDEFTNCNTGICNFRQVVKCQPKAVEGESRHLNKFHNFNDIKEKHPLKLYGCVKVPFSDDLLAKLEQICYISYQDFHSVSINNVYEMIADDVNKMKIRLKDELVLDPVYAIIYQDDDCMDQDDQHKFTKIIMVYPMYQRHEGSEGSEGYPDGVDTGVCRIEKVRKSDEQNKQDAVRKYFNRGNKTTGCKGIVYQLNKNHKMFYDVLKKTENIML